MESFANENGMYILYRQKDWFLPCAGSVRAGLPRAGGVKVEFSVSEEERRFRDEVRTWIEENKPREKRPDEGPEMRDFDTSWQRRQYEGGWAGISWPQEYGGRGLGLTEQLIWYEEYARANAPWIGSIFVGLNHGGPTLIARGSEEQKSRYLPAILRGEEIWCQGFSEPNAGSDLAGIRTRAEIDGDDLVVNGQKIWTSFAYVADFQELLVRTDPAAPKHKGITWAVCDMRSKGIEIRRIRAMSGRSEFAEVFYNDVRVPLKNVVGEINDGWSVAMSTLGFERGTAFISAQVEMTEQLERLVRLAETTPDRNGKPAIRSERIGHMLARLRAEVNALRAMTHMSVSRARRGDAPGPRGSVIRLYFSGIHIRMAQLAREIVGDGLFAADGDERHWAFEYFACFRSTIAAGTSEIQRNIIGERLLGLPKGS